MFECETGIVEPQFDVIQDLLHIEISTEVK